MASDKTADKTVTPERIIAAATAVALAKEREPREHVDHGKAGATALALGALGVVYGDIGTSPLYSLKEAFTEKSHRLPVDRDQRLRGVLVGVLVADHHHLDQVPDARDARRQPR